MAVTVDFIPMSTIVLYFWLFVVILFRAMELEDNLPLQMRMVAEFIDVKACVQYPIMMFIVNRGTKTIENIRIWLLCNKCVKGIQCSYYKKNFDQTLFGSDLYKMSDSRMSNADKGEVGDISISENCKALTWIDRCLSPETMEQVIGENISPEKDVLKDKDEVQNVTELLTPDELIIIPVENLNTEKNVDFNQAKELKRRVKNRRMWTRKKRTSCDKITQTTKSDSSSAFEFPLTAGTLFTLKPSKKAFLLMVLVLSVLSPTIAAPIRQDPERRGLYEYKLLLTSNCNYRDLILSETCQTNGKLAKLYIDFCGFADLCGPGFKPICVDGDGGGMFHICSPNDLTCSKGYRRRAWLNSSDSDVVLVQEEKCPQGWYQSDKSDCYDACLNRHEDIKDLPNQYAIYSKGDHLSPTWIYCDFEKGFYNMDGKFLLAYNEEFEHFPYFCTSVSDVNFCASGEYPLPDGTCVSPCEKDFKRDAHDGFKCKEKTGDVVQRQKGKNAKDEEYRQTISMVNKTHKRPIEIDLTKQVRRTKTNDTDGIDPNTLHSIVITVLVVIALLIAFVLCVLVWIYRTKNKSKSIRIKNENRTENRTIIDKVENVNITHTVTTRANSTDDAPVEMQPFIGGHAQQDQSTRAALI